MTTWLLTYLVHSTILIGLVAVLSRFLKHDWLPLEENLWRVAILGGLVTASLRVGLPIEPLGGAWVLGRVPAAPDGIPATLDLAPSAYSTLQVASSSVPPLSSVLVAIWMIGGILLTLRLAFGYVELERRIRSRHVVHRGPLFNLLEGLLQKPRKGSSVRLSTSSRIEVPLAKGWWRQEICLPERAASELAIDQQETILAHELAHLQRHDPRWLTLFRLVETLFFFQPLNRLARRRMQELAEYQCDDWAVEKTGRPVTMARCLASVAEWNLRQDRSLPTPALTSRGQDLKRRVSRLLDRRYPLARQNRPTWLLPAATILLLLAVLAVPGFSIAESGEPPQAEPTEPAPPAAPAAPDVSPLVPAPPLEVIPPVVPIPPITPIDARRHELEVRRQSLQSELREIDAALELEVRSMELEAQEIERTLARELETIERELQTKIQLQKHQAERIEFLHQHLLETVERHKALQEAELHRLRLEQSQREDPQDP